MIFGLIEQFVTYSPARASRRRCFIESEQNLVIVVQFVYVSAVFLELPYDLVVEFVMANMFLSIGLEV